MAQEEIQEEEREVLSSIYEGDESFKQIDDKTYQYKFGESDTAKSFLLEIKWSEKYPNELPSISMDTFYNKHVGLAWSGKIYGIIYLSTIATWLPSVKKQVVDTVTSEAEQYLGMSMTYSLFEFVKEKFEELIELQPDAVEKIEDEKILSTTYQGNEERCSAVTMDEFHQDDSSKKEKKEQLTKAQKRRQWNRTDGKGEKPRGWNWVDIVKHLSQTGPANGNQDN